MKCLIGVVLLASLWGCAPPKDASTSVQPTASDPLEASFSGAPNAAEWLMNTKHTLRGLSPEQTVAVLSELNQAGIVEIRLGDIQADAADPSFKSAGTVIVQFPSSEGARKGAFDIFARRNLPILDQGQKYLEVEVAVLAPQTPSP